MKVDCLSPLQLPARLRERWAAYQAANPLLSSPYFTPEFSEAVTRVRADTFVAVIDDGDAFLPFHRGSFNFGTPVGFGLSDYQGLISPANYIVEPLRLVREIGLSTWEFNHVPASQACFSPWSERFWESPQVDILEWSRTPPKLSAERRKERKLAREIGRLEFEFDCRDPDAFRLCMTWKSEQHARTRTRDIMRLPWVAPLLTNVLAMRENAFCGVLSVLRAGGKVVAAHFGIRSRGVLHYWFPSYDISLAPYSPGMVLLMSLLEASRERGINIVDLGRGDSLYKTRVATTATPLIEGAVTPNAWARRLLRSRNAVAEFVLNTPFRGAARAVINRIRP